MLNPYLYTLDGLSADVAAEYKEVDFTDLSPEQAKRFKGIQKDGEPLFLLTVEASNGWELGNLGGMKSALESERNANKENTSRYAGINPEEVKLAAQELEDLKAKFEAKSFSKDDAVNQVRADMAKLVEQKEAAWNTEKTALEADLHSSMIVTTAREELAKGGFSEMADLMLPHLMKSMRIGREAGSGKAHVEIFNPDADDQPRRLGETDSSWMDTKGRVAEMRKDKSWERLADGSGNSGGGLKSGETETVQPGTNQSNLSSTATLASTFKS